MQKNETGVRITHPDSGSVGESRDERSQLQNKKRAFERLVARPEFQQWHKLECARRMGRLANINEEVKKEMEDKNLLIEINVNGKWIKYENLSEEEEAL